MSDAPAAAGKLPGVKLDARELELARLPDGSVVAKRGVREVLVRGPEAGALLEECATLLDGTRTAEELVAAVAPERRGHAVRLLRLLIERRLLADVGTADTAESRFWATFGSHGATGPERLQRARVTVLGGDLVARGLVEQLVACGVGTLDVVPEPRLIAREDAEGWLRELKRTGNGGGRVRRVDPADASGSVAGCTLLCATSDSGLTGALNDVNREALAAEVPFLPAWISDLIGYIGPLTEPHDTACLRCYELRGESNSRYPAAVRALRENRERNPTIRDVSGMLAPMAAAVSAVAAMEVVKRVTGVMPPDTAARLIEVNLISFHSRVRRVLKLPRCPDCSDVMRRSAVALAIGPQVPGRG